MNHYKEASIIARVGNLHREVAALKNRFKHMQKQNGKVIEKITNQKHEHDAYIKRLRWEHRRMKAESK